MYRIEQNFGGKKIWRNYDFEILAEKNFGESKACLHFRASSGILAKNLANCGDSPNSPKFSPRQSFVLYGMCASPIKFSYNF